MHIMKIAVLIYKVSCLLNQKNYIFQTIFFFKSDIKNNFFQIKEQCLKINAERFPLLKIVFFNAQLTFMFHLTFFCNMSLFFGKSRLRKLTCILNKISSTKMQNFEKEEMTHKKPFLKNGVIISYCY